jgi:hypothetical protein
MGLMEDWMKERIDHWKNDPCELVTDWNFVTDDLKVAGSDLINIPEMGVAPIIDSFVHPYVVWTWIAAEDWNQDERRVYAHSEDITVYCVLGLDGELYFAWKYPKADYDYPWFMVNSEDC